jgi:hypothetical protein
VTAPRNQVALLARLWDGGALTLPMLRQLDIRHEVFCPANDHRTLDCVCHPAVFYHGFLVGAPARVTLVLAECVTKTA